MWLTCCREVAGGGGTHLPLDLVCDGGSLLLDEVDLGLDVGTDGLEVADDGALDRARKVGVAFGQELGGVADIVQDCLPAVGRKDVTLMERNLDRLGQSGGRPCGGVLDVNETL